MSDHAPTLSIAIAICTYNRNGPLNTLLEAIFICARYPGFKGRVGLVVVDDSADGNARSVVEQFDGRFELGITYVFSGKQNISMARNAAIEAASRLGEWTVMVDDDCEPVPEWLEAMIDVQARTGADAVTGPMVRRVPPGSPKWLVKQPFLELGMERLSDCSKLTVASTFNSMISSRWLKDHPTVRFEPSLGVVGGEDMVFYRAANALGLRIFYSERAFVYENEPPERATFGYQLRLHFWHGNSSYISSVRSGVSPVRMLLHAINSFRKAAVRPLARICKGQSPEWRFTLALVLHSLGKVSGVLGIQVRHK